MPQPTSTASRKRTRSTNISENGNDHQPSTSTIVPTNPAPPKRQRNNPSQTRSNYSLRNRSITSDSRQSSSIDTSTSSERYNLRPRRPQLQVSNPLPTAIPRRTRRQNASTVQQEPTSSPVIQPRQYRLLYISDDDDQPTANTQTSATVYDENDEAIRSTVPPRRTARPTSNTARSRTVTDPTNTTIIDNPDFANNGGAHVRLNHAIEIVIDSIQSLEGAVNNFDQLVFSLIYGRLSARTEFESIEGMIRLSRILNLNFPSRLTQDEIDALPKIKFLKNKSDSTASILLVEKCPICLTEFSDQEIINKLHCTHLFHSQCISTWLSENDSCPTCRRKVNGD